MTGRRAVLSGGVARVWVAPPGAVGPAAEGPWPPWPAPWRPLGTGPASVTLDGRAVVVEVDVHADPPWPPEAAADAAALRDEAATTAGLVPWTVGLDWGPAGRAVVDGVTVDGWEADRDVWSARFAGVGVGVALAWSGAGR